MVRPKKEQSAPKYELFFQDFQIVDHEIPSFRIPFEVDNVDLYRHQGRDSEWD